MKTLVLAALLVGVIVQTRASAQTTPGNVQTARPEPVISESMAELQRRELSAYLKAHWQTPEDYVVSTFATHDIVFVGESHRIKHDVELVQNLIPRLYKAGVYVLGMEFAATEEQESIDRLVSGNVYDEAAARQIMFNSDSTWGYIEYEDILRSAWKLNAGLPKGARRFRIVALNYEPRYELLTEADDLSAMPVKVFYKGDYDAFMASVVLREIVDKGDKALIYAGMHHAFTKYRRKINRTGNIVYDRIGEKTFTIALHHPWSLDPPVFVYPVNGAIDQVMSDFTDKRVGFDLAGSPFGLLDATASVYGRGRKQLQLQDWADGYVYQKPINAYEGCTVDRKFINDDNISAVIAKYPNVAARKSLTVQTALEEMRRDADFGRRFKDIR